MSISGRIASVNVSPSGIPRMPQERARVLHDRLEGDGRAHDKHDTARRAVSILGLDQIERFRAMGFPVTIGATGENFSVEGFDVQSLDPGTQLRCEGGVVLEVVEPRIPCYVLDAIHPALKDAAWGAIGQMARVVVGGVVSAGERIDVGPNRLRSEGPQWPRAVAILAGGKSSRMGAPKENLDAGNGRTMLERAVETAARVAKRVVVCGNGNGIDLEALGATRVRDIHPGCGPLSGIEAALASGIADRYLVLACDQPRLSPYLLRILAEGDDGEGAMLRSETGRKLDPLPGIYPAAWLGALRERIAEGKYSARDFVRTMNPRWVTIPERFAGQVASVNTPDELAAWRVERLLAAR